MHIVWKCSILVMILACDALSFRRPMKVTTKCCKSVSSGHFSFSVTSYSRQNSLAPCVRAIIFETDKGEKICSDPRDPWVQKKMKDVPEIP